MSKVPPPKIVDGDMAALLFVQAVGERRGGRLVDQPQDFETRNFAGIFGGLALRVVEIRGHGDYGAIHGLAEVSFGPVLKFTKDECGNLRRGEGFVAEPDADYVLARRIDAKRKELQFILNVRDAAAHQALHGVNAALGLREQAAARRFTDDDATVGIDADDGGAERRCHSARNALRLTRLRITYATRLLVVPRSIPTISSHV